jgi:hypothetical protein
MIRVKTKEESYEEFSREDGCKMNNRLYNGKRFKIGITHI